MITRIAVANLVPRIYIAETGESHFLGLLNRRKLAEGERVFGALGGAMQLTPTGIDHLRRFFRVTFEKEPDAIFTVHPWDAQNVLDILEGRSPSFCELSPSREMFEELTGTELSGMPPILTPEELSVLTPRFARIVEQARGDDDLRASGKAHDPPTRRQFHLFGVTMPHRIFNKMRAHPAVKFFTAEEIATTQQGLVRGRAADGSIIGTNLLW